MKLLPLSELARTTSGGTPTRGNKAYYGGNVPWLKSGELPDGEILSAEETITPLGLKCSSAKLLPAGTLLIAMYGATVGKLGILTFPAATNQAVCAITPGDELDRDYLFHWLLGVRSQLIETSFGGAQPNISQAVIRDLDVPWVPVTEQRRIAAHLKAQLAEVETARQATQVQLREIKSLIDAIVRDGIAASDGEPLVLGDVVRIDARIVDPKDSTRSALPHISAENISSITGTLHDVQSAAEDGMESGKYLFDAGNVLYSKLRPYLRKATVVNFVGLCSADMYPLCYNKDRVDPEYLRTVLVSDTFTAYANEMSARSRMPKLNREQLLAYKFELPSIDEQRRIVVRLKSQLAEADALRTALNTQQSELAALPQRLLAQAFEH